MKFDLVLAKNESVVKSWCYADSISGGERIADTLTVTNKRIIFEQKGKSYVEKKEIPIYSIEAVNCSYGQKKVVNRKAANIFLIVGLLLAALGFGLPKLLGNGLSGGVADTLTTILPYVLYAGAGLFVIGLVLLIAALCKPCDKIITISIVQNHAEYVRYEVYKNNTKSESDKIDIVLNTNISNVAVEIINELSALILNIQTGYVPQNNNGQ